MSIQNSTRKHKRDKDHPGIENAPYTSVGKDGRVVWEPGLPAMVTSRRQPRPQKKPLEEENVPCDLKAVLKLSSEAKPDWLYKALQAVPRGRAHAHEIYTVLTHPKFAAGVTEWHGQRMLRIIKEHLDLFSEKQHRTLTTKCELAQRFRSPSPSRSRSRGSDRSKGGDLESASGSCRFSAEDACDRQREPNDGTIPTPGDNAWSVSTKEQAVEISPEERERRAKEQREKIAQGLKDTEEVRQKEMQRQQEQRRVQAEREKQRKARLGNAFAFGGDDDFDRLSMPSAVDFMKSRDARRTSAEDRLPLHSALSSDAASPSDVSRPSGAKGPPVVNSQFVEAMGGDKVLNEVHALLVQKIAPENRGVLIGKNAGSKSSSSPSRTRGKRRNRSISRSRSNGRGRRRGAPRREEEINRTRRVQPGSLRSPTPDGRARGQMRAARKAKMIASCLGFASAPRRQ
eukprot:TRINITY_DN69783_c0_g1_i1.p1 TRINITY_DN69783_c0_g1~~TRINITY_DN69783_c0_g1_i1.p1  ORF type:complete len:457 (-),score=70.11 TRINITY_DN69783_c0_g1_i1:99-1469(-)